MKKIIVSLILVCTLFSTGIYCSADCGHIVDDITIIYQEDSMLTDTQKERFLSLVFSEQNEYAPYSLLCLFGHDKVTEYAHIIKHKVFSVEPRCANQLYEVITCTRCDYMDATLVSQAFFNCCPED
ncbi:MAG: hypothetical protein IKI93_06945 [Clostridia bacterium]|nr:hypothetical protein [Clostridia bacterium]